MLRVQALVRLQAPTFLGQEGTKIEQHTISAWEGWEGVAGAESR